MKRFLLMTAVVLLTALSASAQRTVSGTVVDKDTKEGIIQATVSLLKTDSTLVQNFVTDLDGNFKATAPNDGRFLLFTMSDYGCFPIWHKEADQWLLDLQTGDARPLDEVNSDDTDSFHNWSSNSRWIVFTSRRGNGYYTNLYLAHVDKDGRMGKPFLLPQRNPWAYYDETLFSFNTPDFTSEPVKLDARTVARDIMSDKRVETVIR